MKTMKKLLLVDDDTAILKQLSFALASHYKVLEAANAQEALMWIEKESIDIALVDLGLPPFENTHTQGKIIITELLEKTDAKVLVLTGQEDPLYPKELIAMGVFDYIKKPIDIHTLLEALKRASFFRENETFTTSKDEVTLLFQTSLEDGLKGSADKAQKELLTKVLHQTGFNVNQTAKILGISRENCYYFLKKFHIHRPNND